MPDRRQLPPQIKRVELTSRAGGRPVIRYQLTVDVGIVDGKRKQLRKRYATEQEARKALDEIRGDVSRGTYVHPTTLTVDQACGDWLLSRHRIKPSSAAGYEWILTPVREQLGEMPVQKLTRRDIDGLIRVLRAGGSTGANAKRPRKPWGARSCNYMLGSLSQVLEQLVADGTLTRNVASLVDRVPSDSTKFPTLTADQVRTVVAGIANHRDRHAWHLALGGLRRGEIAGLRWRDIDLEAEVLRISSTRLSVAGKAFEQTGGKSESAGRTLPIPAPLLTELKAARKRQAAEKLALGADYADQGYVVVNEGGEPYHPSTLSKMWVAAIKGLDVPRIRLHDARHTCATLMHLQGVPIAVIAAWIGHADSAFTLRTYAHSQPDALAEAAESLAGIVR